MLNSQSRWIRQEYKTNKDKFEKPFKITVENCSPENIPTQIILEQNYKGLGCTVWDGSIALAKMFEGDLELKKNLSNSKVLELGAGCGLVGLVLAHLGAKFVLLTDMEICLSTLRKNVTNNSQTLIKDSVQVAPYVWGETTTELTKHQGKFNIIVAAEVLYDEADSRLLAESAIQLLAKGGVMFVSMGRNRKGKTAFVETMNANGYSTAEVSVLVMIKKLQLPLENLTPALPSLDIISYLFRFQKRIYIQNTKMK